MFCGFPFIDVHIEAFAIISYHLGSWHQQLIYSSPLPFQSYLSGSSWKEIRVWSWFGRMRPFFLLIYLQFFAKRLFPITSCRWSIDCSADSLINSTLRCDPLDCWWAATSHPWSSWTDCPDVHFHVQFCKGQKRFGPTFVPCLDRMVISTLVNSMCS